MLVGARQSSASAPRPRWRADAGPTTGRIGTIDIARTADTAAEFLSEPSQRSPQVKGRPVGLPCGWNLDPAAPMLIGYSVWPADTQL